MINGYVHLITKQISNYDDPLNHEENLKSEKVFCQKITELSGAQRQIDLFGERYDHAWVIRLIGNYKADYVSFCDESDDKTRYTVNQIRKHRNRTDIYIVDTKVGSNHDLG